MQNLSRIKFLLPIWFLLFAGTIVLDSCQQEYDLTPRLYFEVKVLEINQTADKTNVAVQLSDFNTEYLESVNIKNVAIGNFEIIELEKNVDKNSSKIDLNLSIPADSFEENAFVKVTAETPDKTIGTYYNN